MKQMTKFLMMAFLTANAFAGDKAGGGGAGVVCRDPKGIISSVKLLDLYQAEVERGLVIPRSTSSREVQISEALKKLNPYLAFELRDTISRIKFDYLPGNIRMQQAYDLGSTPVMIEDNCSTEWVAYYNSKNELKIVTKYFNLMSNTDQAALFIHEGLYKIARDVTKDEDSEKTRQLVGVVFSKQSNLYELNDLMKPLIRTDRKLYFECHSNSFNDSRNAVITKPNMDKGKYSIWFFYPVNNVHLDFNAELKPSSLTRYEGQVTGRVDVYSDPMVKFSIPLGRNIILDSQDVEERFEMQIPKPTVQDRMNLNWNGTYKFNCNRIQ